MTGDEVMNARTGSADSSGRDGGTRPVVAIAGATGFVGSHLLRTLTDRFHVVALGRTPGPVIEGVTWRACDLFSSTSTHAALEGVDILV